MGAGAGAAGFGAGAGTAGFAGAAGAAGFVATDGAGAADFIMGTTPGLVTGTGVLLTGAVVLFTGAGLPVWASAWLNANIAEINTGTKKFFIK